MAQYLVLIYEDEAGWRPAARPRKRRARPHRGSPRPTAAPRWSAARRCSRPRTATTIRDGVVTDGPFAETKEALGGYYLIEADDLDQRARDRQGRPGAVRRRRGAPDHGASADVTTAADAPSVPAAVADGAPSTSGRCVLAATVRVTRDLDLAEECVQDAYVQRADAWRDGVPASPARG